MDTAITDVRYALRTLARAKGFTALVVLCLAIGIGANTTVFSAVEGLLLRPMPFRDAGNVVVIQGTQLRNGHASGSVSYPDYLDLATGAGAFAGAGLATQRSFNLGGIGEPERLKGARITASLFPMLGLQPAFGRGLRDEEDLVGKVVMLSDGLWKRRFAGDRGVLGRAVTINGAPYTVIGVMPTGIGFPESAELWLPLEPGDARDHREWRGYDMFARLAPGITSPRANVKLAAISRRLAAQYPASNEGWGHWMQSYRDRFVADIRPIVLVMLGAVGFVLLIACANVANLLLARGAARQKEIAVRLALGASRSRIVRQLLTESLIVSVIGGALGVLIGIWGLDAIKRALPPELPFWMYFEVDRAVLLYTLAVTIATCFIFGLLPALQASSPTLTETLKDGGRGTTTGVRAGRLRHSLVVTEMALSIVLLVGATLMITSFVRMQTVEPGFEAGHVLTMETSLQGERYASDSSLVLVYGELIRRLEALPGAERAGAVGNLPLSSCCNWTSYHPEDRTYPPGESPNALFNTVTPGFFDALRIRVMAGRVFDERDAMDGPRVAVVNRTLAEKEWPGQSAIGRRLKFNPIDTAWMTVVGVVEDVKQGEFKEPARPQLYNAYAQQVWRSMAIVVRTTNDPAALTRGVRGAFHEFDPGLPVVELETMEAVVRGRLFTSRIFGVMFGVFAVAALLLASIGLYGVMAYSVAQRTHELGVRMALGAEPRDVLRLVVRQGARLAGLGLLLGIPGALMLSRLLRGSLYGVSPSDPATFLGISALLAAVALLASYLPARRAARLDPVVALRHE